MGQIIQLKNRRRNPISVAGVQYIHVWDFAERVGVTVTTVYQWNYEGRIPFAVRYLGKLYFEEKAVEPFKKTLMEKVNVLVCR